MTGLRCTPISAEIFQHPLLLRPVRHTFTLTHTHTQLNLICHWLQWPVFFTVFILTNRPAGESTGYLILLHNFSHMTITPAQSLRFHHFHTKGGVFLKIVGVCVWRENETGFFTLLIFSLGWVRSDGKWLRASQLRTTCVCSSVPVTMLPTALSAAVWMWRGTRKHKLTGWGGVEVVAVRREVKLLQSFSRSRNYCSDLTIVGRIKLWYTLLTKVR